MHKVEWLPEIPDRSETKSSGSATKSKSKKTQKTK
jgi:hypothetical protein